MTILSPTKITGQVEAILVNPDAEDESIETKRVAEIEMSFAGISGDRHAGLTSKADIRYVKQYKNNTVIRNTRQVSIVCPDELQTVAEAIGAEKIEPEWLGANLLISGIPRLTLLPPSTRMLFSSGAALVIDNENQACRYPADVIDNHFPGAGARFVKAADNRRGLIAWVEREGSICLNDQVKLHIPPQRIYDPAHDKAD